MQEEGLLLQETQILHPSAFSTQICFSPYSVELEEAQSLFCSFPHLEMDKTRPKEGNYYLPKPTKLENDRVGIIL